MKNNASKEEKDYEEIPTSVSKEKTKVGVEVC